MFIHIRQVIVEKDYLASTSIAVEAIKLCRVAGTNSEYSDKTLIEFKDGTSMIVDENYATIQSKILKAIGYSQI